ncbi:hypothetical protein WA158_007306 [Blastocystis sp. Blastoise]
MFTRLRIPGQKILKVVPQFENATAQSFMPKYQPFNPYYRYPYNPQPNFFSTMPHPNADRNLEFFAIKRQKDELLKHLNPKKLSSDEIHEKIVQLMRLPLDLDIREYTKALSCCYSLELSDYVMGEVRKHGIEPDLLMYNIYLRKCDEFHKKDEAFRTLNDMLSNNINPDRYTLNYLVKACLGSDSPKEAEDIMQRLISDGIDVDAYIFNLLIDYYGRKELPSEAFRIRINMQRYNITPDEYTISGLMASCFPNVPCKSQIKILLEDVKNYPLPARQVCTNSLFAGLSKANHLEPHLKFSLMLDFFNTLRERGYTLGQHAYTSLISTCAKLGDIENAQMLLEDMRHCNIPINYYVATAYISTCSKAKNYPLALEMFNFMKTCVIDPNQPYPIRPNKLTYEAMIMAAGTSQRLDDAFKFFDEMVQLSMYPDASTYSRLLIATGFCNNKQRALEVIKEAEEKRIEKTTFFYHAMIDMYCRVNEPENAYKVLMDVCKDKKIVPGHHHYEPLIRYYCNQDNWEKVDELLKMWKNVSYVTFQELILISNKKKNYECIMKYEKMMREHNLKPYSALLPIIEDAYAHSTVASPVSNNLSSSITNNNSDTSSIGSKSDKDSKGYNSDEDIEILKGVDLSFMSDDEGYTALKH